MHKLFAQTKADAAFTRTELLTLILTVAVLGGALFAFLAGSRIGGRKYTCESNLKILGAAMAMYEKDNAGRLPYGFVRYDNAHFSTWDTLVFPYVRPQGYNPKRDRAPKGVLRCPSDPLLSPDGERRRTYSMPAHSMKQQDWPPGGQNATGLGLWWQPKAKGMADVANLVATEEQQGTNILTAATNVFAIRMSMISAPATTLLLTEQIKSNNVAFQYQNATIRGVSDHVDKRGISADQIHNGKINYLMVDGHVEKLFPMQSVGQQDPRDPGAAGHPNVWTLRPDD